MADRTDTFYSVADDALVGYGAQLLVGNGASPETYQAVAGVTEITPGEQSNSDIDVTHLRSPNRHREHRSGIRDSGPFNVTGIWLMDDESQSVNGGGAGSFVSAGLAGMAVDGLNRNFKIVYYHDGSPSKTLGPFEAYVATFQPGAVVLDDKVGFVCNIMPTQAYDQNLP